MIFIIIMIYYFIVVLLYPTINDDKIQMYDEEEEG